MLNTLFQPIFTDSFTLGSYLICTLTALALGLLVALCSRRSGRCSKSFLFSLILLPPIVQTVIMMVNGNIGTGIAVMGAFGLVRFRSAPGNAREIVSIFLSMAIGLATAIGYIGIAVIFTAFMCAIILIGSLPRLKSESPEPLELRITVPESLNYSHAFDDLFEKYSSSVKLVKAKTTNMGSLYRLYYRVTLKNQDEEQALIDELRCRNGNLEISLGLVPTAKEEL